MKFDQTVIVGDFNIHDDLESDGLNISFSSLLDSVGFYQKMTNPTHYHNHTPDLIVIMRH